MSSKEGKDLHQELSDIIGGGTGLCEKTGRFLKIVASVLDLKESDYDVAEKDILHKITYHDRFIYQYESVFSAFGRGYETLYQSETGRYENITPDELIEVDSVHSSVRPALADKPELRRKGVEEMTAGDESPGYREENAPAAEQAISADFSPAVRFRIVGSRSWNTREPYIIRISGEKLEQDYQDLSVSIYYLDDSSDPDTVENEIRISMIKYLRKKSENITDSYRQFVKSHVDRQVSRLIENFEIDGEKEHLFIYHLGPFNMYRIIVNVFQSLNIGFCYKYMEGNRIKRYLPYEFLKESVLEWYEQNINGRDLPFDMTRIFDEIRKTVARKYYAELGKVNKVIDATIRKSNLGNKTFDKYELFKSKWDKWFGTANIVVYRRFIEKTIFG